MSHFCLLVALPELNDETLAAAMQPYHEYECTDIKDEYVVFVPTETTNDWNEPGAPEITHREYYKKYKEKYNYTSFMSYMVGEGCEQSDDGVWGKWTNPNRKWDWWLVGGRWSGLLLTKSGKEVDHCLKHELDIDGIEVPRRESATKKWDLWNTANYHHTPMKLMNTGSQKYRQLLREHFGWLAGKSDIKQLERMSRDEYITCDSRFAPYAFLYDGKWYEQGKMLMFGMSVDEESSWPAQFKELFKDIPNDYELVIVDCHT